MLADIDLVDDTSPLYTVRCACPAKNATSQLYTIAGRSSSEQTGVTDSVERLRKIQRNDDDKWIGLQQVGDSL